MKTFLNAISILFFLLVLLVSCKSRKPLEPETIIDTRYVKEVVRDTVINVEADSTYYNAWIECKNGKPVLREPRKTQKPKSQKETGKALQKPKVNLDENGKLTVECYKEVEEIKARLTDKYESLLREHKKSVYIEKPFAWYHKALMWLGGLFLIITGVIIILKIKN